MDVVSYALAKKFACKFLTSGSVFKGTVRQASDIPSSSSVGYWYLVDSDFSIGSTQFKQGEYIIFDTTTHYCHGTFVTKGRDGVGIDRVEKTATVDDVDTYTMTFTDGSTFEFTIKNGGGSGDATLEHEVVCNVAAGNAPIGTVLPEGMSFTEYVERVHVATLSPVVTINTPTATTKEVGEVITTLPIKATITKKTYTLSKAEFYNNNVLLNTITGIPTNGVVQMDYACNNNDTNMTIKVVATDSNGLKGQSSVDIKFSRGIFYGTSTGNELYNTSALIRGLSNKELGKAKGYKFTINIPVGTKSVIIAIPSTLGSIADVNFRESMNMSVLSSFNISNVNVEGANGYTAMSYKVYQYTSVAGFSQLSHYDVTL